MIIIPAFYLLCGLGAAIAILAASPYYRDIGEYVSGLFQDAKDAINDSDGEGDEYEQ